MAKKLDGFAPGTGSADGYRELPEAQSDRLHRISDDYFFWKSIGGIGNMIDPKAGFSPKILGDVLSMRMGRSVAGTVRKFVPDPRVAQMLDHFVQYVGSSAGRCLPGGAVRHRPHADRARASGTRWAVPGPCPTRSWKLADGTRCRIPSPRRA